MHEPEYCTNHGKGAYYCGECVDEEKRRADRLETALRDIVELAGNASISVETLAAFSPLTAIIVTASEALDDRRSTGPEGK